MDDRHTMIENYVDGKLVGAALETFQEKLNHDPQLAKDVQLLKKLRANLSIHLQSKQQEEDLIKTLNGLGDLHFSEPGLSENNNSLPDQTPAPAEKDSPESPSCT